MAVVIEVSHLINNYPLGSKGFGDLFIYHLELILSIG